MEIKMTVVEFYELTQGNYADVIGRLRKDERILKYLRMFLADDSYQGLCESVNAKEYRKAFEYAHNLKGVCANLGIGALFHAADRICEELRGGNPGSELSGMLEDVIEEYEKTAEGIKQL